jgi:hypothetical protein
MSGPKKTRGRASAKLTVLDVVLVLIGPVLAVLVCLEISGAVALPGRGAVDWVGGWYEGMTNRREPTQTEVTPSRYAGWLAGNGTFNAMVEERMTTAPDGRVACITVGRRVASRPTSCSALPTSTQHDGNALH